MPIGFRLAVLMCCAYLQTEPCVADDAATLPTAVPISAPTPLATLASDQWLSAGARIGRILIDHKDIFDTSLQAESAWSFRLANALHVRTRPATVHSWLLFKPGDLYDPRVIAESERLLRTAQFLHDARIVPVSSTDGLVDVKVYTQDVWTLQPGWSIGRKGGKNSSSFGIEDTNFLGTGREVGVFFKSGLERDSKSLNYRDRKLAGSWWQLSAQYADNSDGGARKFSLERPFYALDTRWAAGLAFASDQRIDTLYENGQANRQLNARDRSTTVYGGGSQGLQNGWVNRWTAGYTHDFHETTPTQNSSVHNTPVNRLDLSYPWISAEWIEDQFEETQNQDQIGKTEDLFLGWRTQFKLGYASSKWGSNRNAGLFNTAVSKGLHPRPRHTLLLNMSLKGRVEDQRPRSTWFSGSARYYVRQSPVYSFYMGASAIRGIRLDPDQQVLLGGHNGLRGYPAHYQSGNQRWLVSAEQRAYTDWYLLRLFRVGAAAFFDVGQARGGPSASTDRQGVLKDVGIGLRLGNSRSGFGNVIHIDVALPVTGDKSISKAQLLLETKRSF